MLRPFRGILPQVDPSVYIDESAQVIGDVRIGADSRRTNIQDGTIVHVMRDTHPARVGDEVTVGHAAVLHGCTIEDRCLIGMGAMLLNGAVIGSDSIVAAGTLVTEETKIPPRSLVMGRPVAERRALTDAEVASIRDYAERCVGYKKDYATSEPGVQGSPGREEPGGAQGAPPRS